jgi:D-aminopeptidase
MVRHWPTFLYCALLLIAMDKTQLRAEQRPRIRELGVTPGILPTGKWNAITDVAGVRVGHCSIIRGQHIRTGVTAILPHHDNLFQAKVPAAVYVGNGFGKAAGFLQVQELGNLETPIVLTNTMSVGRAVEAVVRWTLDQPGNERVRSVNAVVGETNDAYLNDIRGMHVDVAHVRAAIDDATSGPVEEGSVGAGVGTRCYGFKGGIGTASRRLPEKLGGYTVGALVQTNFGGVLQIDGVRVGEQLGRYAFQENLKPRANTPPTKTDTATKEPADDDQASRDEGSVMIVIATDAPMLSRNLQRLARRAVLGLARTGSFMSNGSGDFVIAFSTRNRHPEKVSSRERVRKLEELDNHSVTPLMLAVVESVEEAVYNSLTRATTVHGRDGHTVEAIPIGRLREMFQSRSGAAATSR